MDFYGKQNFLKYITNFLLNTKEFRKSEYIDFYNYGFEKRSLYNAGFYEVSNYKKQLIIPDLFGPFIKKNNDVFFFTNKKTTKNIQIFRLMVIKICLLIKNIHFNIHEQRINNCDVSLCEAYYWK